MDKKFLIWCLLTISAIVPLSLFFTGPMDMAKNIDGPGRVVPTGKSIHLDTSMMPGWWTRFNLILRYEPIQDCGSLRVAFEPDTIGIKPIHCNQEKALFRIQSDTGPPSRVTLFNPTDQTLVFQRYSLTNYSEINTGPPRLAILLTPYPVPAFPWQTSILLILIASFLPLPGLILFWYRGVRRLTQWQLWVPIFSPWVVLIFAGAMLLGSRQLLLSWETVLITCLPGYLLLALTSRFFQEKLFVPMIVSLIVLNFGILIGTNLGVGLPLKLFVLGLIYQPQFIITAEYAGMAYLFLAFLLYWKRKEWFSPNKHLFLSSILFIFLPCLIIYLANGYSIWGGDTTFNSLLPWRIFQGEGLSYSKEYVTQHGSWGLTQVGDYFAPVFPMGPGFLSIPTALINYLLTPTPMFSAIGWNQKVTAVLVASLSAAFMFQLVYLVSRKRWLSLLLASGFAFGTTQITISAAALWQHGPAVLLICLGIFFLVRGQQGDPRFFPLAALPLAFLPIMRPQTVVFYLAALASVLCLQPKIVFRFFLWSLPGIFLTLWINLGLYHSFIAGYSDHAHINSFTTPLLEGVAGSLFSPFRGLFIFSPFLILGVAGARILLAKRSAIALFFSLAALLVFLIHAKYGLWFGGLCIAPRFTSELVPVLVFFSIYWFIEVKNLLARSVGWALIIISIAINLPGSFFIEEHNQWHFFPDIDHHQERMWDFRDWLPLHYTYRLRLEHYKETAVYPFVEEGPFEAIKSTKLNYRAKVPLGDQPVEILKLVNVYLKKGAYQIKFKGDSHSAESAVAKLSLDLIGYKFQELASRIERQNSFSLIYPFNIEKSGYTDVRLKMTGKGAIVFDTIQIIPLAMS